MRVQQVLAPGGGPESWTVLDDGFAVVEPVDEFLAYLTVIERSPGTVRSYAFDLRDYFAFLAAHGLDWRSVRLEHLGRFVGWLRLPSGQRSVEVTSLSSVAGACSASTINRKLAALGSFYRYQHRHGVDCGELLTEIKPGGARGSWRPFLAHLGSAGDQRRRTIKLKTERRLPRTLTDEQVGLIIGACDRLRDRFLIELLTGTGLRIGEALGLRHEDIDAAGRLIRVRSRSNTNGARVKTGQREVPVEARLIRLYTDYLVTEYGDLDCDYVFVNLWGGVHGTAWRYWNVTDLVARLRSRSGVRFSAHWFRHTYATGLLRRGVPAEVVAKLLDHSSVSTTTTTYAHLEIEDLRRVLRAAGCLDVDLPDRMNLPGGPS
ncbi:tyrosine-type recombinase/integrase [Nocardia cyriacigeorgica]|uniref:Integrase n=1 Tax=Nocardia cyriacigeorgica TaxID=135487 RepID=A0A5R8N8F7_9NOCA|nr:tyrosine-type recombinase/integrase [Nocardia cyriacigeorgica]MBF6427880.1 site-specific integrase [Nocardia cyriacigeorgica]TLF71916.1 integrase [Nocardia cyriacigeorgica]